MVKVECNYYKKGVTNLNFKGFMACSAQGNWNVLRIIYEYGDPTVAMINKEQTCFFH
jgi:hypothetical protein